MGKGIALWDANGENLWVLSSEATSKEIIIHWGSFFQPRKH